MGKKSLKIYVVKSIYDKKIEKEIPLRTYEKEIQVGASLTEKKVCELQDNEGENISDRNRQYCELTALYWLWKNADDDYIGISHYRRRFDIPDGVIDSLDDLNVDIVVTVPVINTAGIGYQYCITHGKTDWEILRDEVHRLSPAYDDSFGFVEKQIYFHAYNMFIMRQDILMEFCSFVFPVIFSCEKRIGKKEDTYQNRYPGFLAERLLNVFLYEHRGEYNIYVANKRYLS